MNNFYDWYKTIDHNDQAYLKAHGMNDYMLEAFNAGMERAAVIAEKSIQHVFVNKRHVADVDGRIPAKAIREEIDK